MSGYKEMDHFRYKSPSPLTSPTVSQFEKSEVFSFNNKLKSESEDFHRHLVSKLQNGPIPKVSRISACNGYPCLYISKMGFISVMINPDVRIDVTIDRTVRITYFDKFTVSCRNLLFLIYKPKHLGYFVFRRQDCISGS